MLVEYCQNTKKALYMYNGVEQYPRVMYIPVLVWILIRLERYLLQCDDKIYIILIAFICNLYLHYRYLCNKKH